jgi:hypothetical protein
MAIGEQNVEPIAKAGKVMQYWVAKLVEKEINKQRRKNNY